MLNVLMLGAAAPVVWGLARYANSQAGLLYAAILGIGFLVSVVAWFHFRLQRQEAFERLDLQELGREKGDQSLFQEKSEDALPAKRSRVQFERFFAPGFAILLLIAHVALIYWQTQTWRQPSTLTPGREIVTLALFALVALFLFVLGKYSAAVARLEKLPLLRPGASYQMLGAYIGFLIVAALIAHQAGLANTDRYLQYLLTFFLALNAIDLFLTSVLEIYRPRSRQGEGRILYESRVASFLAQPQDIFKSLAQSLDYQFGFSVSETRLFQWVQRGVAWVILLQLIVLILSTSVVFLEPGEQAIRERFGRPSSQVLGPGLHFKLPWPIDKMVRFPSGQIQSFYVGIVQSTNEHNERTILWTINHYKEEYNLLVASRDAQSGTNAADGSVPVNLLTVSIPVQFQVKDLRAWAYNNIDAAKMLENLAAREVVRYLVGVDLQEIMASGRNTAAADLRKRIQDRANEANLGADILFVGLHDIHPPVKVASAFQGVVAARQEIESKILAAESYRARTIPQAEGEAFRLVRAAEAYSAERQAAALAQAASFTNQLQAFAASPSVYPQRLYLQTFARATQNSRKLVLLATNTHELFQLNLEDKIRTDLLDVEVPPPAPQR